MASCLSTRSFDERDFTITPALQEVNNSVEIEAEIMSEDSFSISHNNLMAEIDAKVFGNKKLIKAQIQAGFWGEIKAIARREAI